MSKTLIIGMDGGDWKFLEPLIEKGKLPNFQKLISKGIRGTLKSTIPSQTIPAWISMFTGKDPGEVGACDFLIPKNKDGEIFFAKSSLWKGSFVWDFLDKKDYRIGLLNIPGSYPAYEINGSMVSSILTPSDEPSTYPENILKGIDYRIDQKEGVALLGKDKLFEDLLDVNKKRFEAFKKIDEENDFDLLILVFTITDRMQHVMIDQKEKINYIYKKIDKQIGEFIDKYDNILVVSDHGFCKLKKPFFINDWLEREGYLTKKVDLVRLFSKIIPTKILLKLSRLIPEKFKKNITKGGDVLTNINFKKSKAFSVSDNSILVKNENLILEIIKKLNKFDFLKAHKSKKLYKKIENENFPQIIIEPEEGCFGYKLSENFFREKLRKMGEHRRKGIFIGSGKEFKKKGEITLDIEDIFHLILYLFGLKGKDPNKKALKTVFSNYKKKENKLKLIGAENGD